MESTAEPAPEGAGPEYIFVDTADALQKMLDRLRGAHRIAVDIEADSLYHYYEKVCLIQLSTDSDTFVLDPLALRDLSGLAPIMSSRAVEKVFHAAAYDVISLRRDYGFSIRRIFDTHVAAQLLGYEQLGLDALLESLLGVAHSKRRQRDDWSRRPLAPEQLRYAAMDTRYLLRLRHLLEERLRAAGRLEWAREEFRCAADPPAHEKRFDPEGYRHIKGSRTLSPGELAALRALYQLRDRCARALDLPPFKVIQNSVLLDLARRPPASPAELFQRPGISFRIARNFAAEIHRTIRKARKESVPARAAGARILHQRPGTEARELLERLKSWRSARARELGLHVGVLFPGNLLEELAVSRPRDLAALEAIEGMRRWRAREFGSEILRILHPE